MKTQHTATPTLDYGPFDEALMNAPEITQEQRERIVHAVNSHQELLEALKMFLDESIPLSTTVKMAKSAIAKAEGTDVTAQAGRE